MFVTSLPPHPPDSTICTKLAPRAPPPNPNKATTPGKLASNNKGNRSQPWRPNSPSDRGPDTPTPRTTPSSWRMRPEPPSDGAASAYRRPSSESREESANGDAGEEGGGDRRRRARRSSGRTTSGGWGSSILPRGGMTDRHFRSLSRGHSC